MCVNKIINVTFYLCTLLLFACGGTEGPDALHPLDAGRASLRVINAAPDSDTVDIYINDSLATSVAYRRASGALEVEAGDLRVDVRLRGAAAATTPLLSTLVRAATATRLTLAVVGRVTATLDASPDPELKLRLLTLGAGSSEANLVKLRLLHAAPSAPPLELDADGRLLSGSVPYANLSVYAALDAELAAGSRLGLRLGGAELDSAFTALTAARGTGSVLTAIAFGEILPTSADERFLAISILDERTGELTDLALSIPADAPRASFYLFNGALDLPSVDLAATGGAVLQASIGYQQASSLLQVAPGTLGIELRAAGTPDAVLSTRLKLLPGTRWSIFLSGLADPSASADANAGVQGRLRLSSDARLGNQLGARARVANLVPDIAALDVTAGGNTWARALVYARTSDVVKLANGFPLLLLTVKASLDYQTLYTTGLDALFLIGAQNQVVTFFVCGAAEAALGRPISVVAVVESELSSRPLSVVTLPSL